MTRTLIAALLLPVGLALGWGAAPQASATTQGVATADSPDDRGRTPQVTRAEYKKVKKGMTLAQVRRVVDARGRYRGNGVCGDGIWTMRVSPDPIRRLYMVVDFLVDDPDGGPVGPARVINKSKEILPPPASCR